MRYYEELLKLSVHPPGVSVIGHAFKDIFLQLYLECLNKKRALGNCAITVSRHTIRKTFDSLVLIHSLLKHLLRNLGNFFSPQQCSTYVTACAIDSRIFLPSPNYASANTLILCFQHYVLFFPDKVPESRGYMLSIRQGQGWIKW